MKLWIRVFFGKSRMTKAEINHVIKTINGFVSAKKALTGITGQDGSYLAELLLKKVMRFMVLFVVLHLLILEKDIHF